MVSVFRPLGLVASLSLIFQPAKDLSNISPIDIFSSLDPNVLIALAMSILIMVDVLPSVPLEAILLLKRPALNVDKVTSGMEKSAENCVLKDNTSTLPLMNVNAQLECTGLEKSV